MTSNGTSEQPMHMDHATVSLAGNRTENQDRVEVASSAGALLLMAVDGMGGHAAGASAAEVTIATLRGCFEASSEFILDPQGFLTLALTKAHQQVVKLGSGVAVNARPRATCAACLLQDDAAYWAHIGDSRIYLLRGGRVHTRTRDHSHVELLLHEGVIAEDEVKSHPMRNFVESCLGGNLPLPVMSISARKPLQRNDVLLLCTDGLWSGLADDEIASLASQPHTPLRERLHTLASTATARNTPHSDNTSVAAATAHKT